MAKDRDTLRNAYTKNFSLNRIDRYIVIDKELETENARNETIKEINEKLWNGIQEINFRLYDRILPFVCIYGLVKDESGIRIIVNDYGSEQAITQFQETKSIVMEDISHLINFRILSPYRQIMVSDGLIPSDAKILIDPNLLTIAAVDIFLDISMFNSFSYLNSMTISEKRQFNRLKIDFFKKHSMQLCPMYYDIKKPYPDYFSLAFCCRVNIKTFDYDKYIWLWNLFLQEYEFDKNKNIIAKPTEILRYHVDFKNLPEKIKEDNYWKRQTKGAILLLRTNHRPNDDLRLEWLKSYLGLKQYRIGRLSIVPLSDINNSMLQRELRELNVSAFKIINF